MADAQTLNFEGLLNEAVSARRRHPEWRAGQAAFNVLAQHHPVVAERVRSGPFDPYYRDVRLPAFWEFVAQQLDSASLRAASTTRNPPPGEQGDISHA